MKRSLNKIKSVALEAARSSGEFALSRSGKMGKISFKKGRNNLVTEVDKKCEKMIIGMIRDSFPSHSVLAEESGGKRSDQGVSWIIDPIDGTTNYTHRFPFFCTSIGVYIDGEPMIGAVYDPSKKELFHAEKGKGAFLNGKKLNVSAVKGVRDSLIVTGFAYDVDARINVLPYFEVILRNAQAVRRMGSAALDLCYVACGRFDAFWEFGLNPWDTAAARLVVEEAGGSVTKIDGSKFNIFDKEIVATNGHIHREMVRLLMSCKCCR